MSFSAEAAIKEVTITGPAADEILALFHTQLDTVSTANITCSRRIVPSCPMCDGGPVVTTCVLKVEDASIK